MVRLFFNASQKVNRWCLGAEKLLLCSLIFIIVFFSFGQIILRNFFSVGFAWIDPMLKTSVLWVAFTGAALASEKGSHIRIDILNHIITNSRLRLIVERVAHICTMAICLLLLVASVRYMVMLSTSPRISVIPGIPDWWLKWIIPYSFVMMILRAAIQLSDRADHGRRKETS